MTTAAARLEPADALAPAAPMSHHRVRLILAGLALGLVGAAALVAGGVYGYVASYEGRILPGVRIGATDLSGLDRAGAAAALEAVYGALGDGRIVITTGAWDVSIDYREVGRRPDVDAMIDTAMAVGRGADGVERAAAMIRVAVERVALEPRVALDEAALAKAVATGLARAARPPVDATIAMTAGGVVTTPARAGRRYDIRSAQAAAIEALRRLDAPARVEIAAAPIEVPAARGDAVVAGVRARVEAMASDLVITAGKKKWTIKASTIRSWIHLEPGIEESVRPVLDRSQIGPALAGVAKAVRVAPVSARFLTGKTGRIVGVQASEDGRRLDVAATAAAIAAELDSRAAGGAPARVAAAVAPVAPKLTTAEAVKVAPQMTLLGSWTTRFPIGDRNYWGANIWVPARFINATVLSPGQAFEWFGAVGPVTMARGFGPGGVIKDGRSDPTGAMGGGMCSSSTTLFNAALRAGLRMGARTNHGYYIDRYPLGLDATVGIFGGHVLTMSFTNDMRTPILIKGSGWSGSWGQGYVRYEIWGVPDGRRVSVSAPVVRNVRIATTRTREVSTLPAGVRKQTEWPANGMDVWVTRVVRDRAGKVIHQETYYSHYQLWDGVIEVGAART